MIYWNYLVKIKKNVLTNQVLGKKNDIELIRVDKQPVFKYQSIEIGGFLLQNFSWIFKPAGPVGGNDVGAILNETFRNLWVVYNPNENR